MPTVQYLPPNKLSSFSELSGGRKLRDFEYYDIRPYATGGHTTMQFFRTDGQQQDMSGSTATNRVSNMVTSGKFDEPFLITNIGLFFRSYSSADETKLEEVQRILSGGKLTLTINNIPVFWRSPIGRCGNVLNFSGFVATTDTTVTTGNAYLALKPHALDPYVYCEENITFDVTIDWTAAETVNAASYLGVYLIGGKYFKA